MMDLKVIIDDYRKRRNNNPDSLILYIKKTKTLEKVVSIAAKSRDENNIKHSHQRLIKNEALDVFAKDLNKEVENIKNVKTFSELINVIENNASTGIGKLAIYDTANRIGIHLGIYPDKVYLHAGTKKGARNLLGKKRLKNELTKNDFPEIFRTLECAEIEDILCIYKDVFSGESLLTDPKICLQIINKEKKGCG